MRFFPRELRPLDRWGGVLWQQRAGLNVPLREHLLVLDALEPLVRALGDVSPLAEGRWSLDARAAPAGVRFADLALVALGGELVALQPLSRSGAQAQAAVVPEPRLDALVGERPVEEGLRAEFEALVREGTPLARCMAAGLIGRLWRPPAGTPARPPGRDVPRPLSAELQALLAGDGPVSAACRWYAALPEPARAAVEEAACEEVERWRGRLGALERRFVGSEETWRELARRWLMARGRLDSLALLAGAVEGSQGLRAAVQEADRESLALRTALGSRPLAVRTRGDGPSST